MKNWIGALFLLLALSSCHKQYLTGYYENYEAFQQDAKWDRFIDEKWKPKDKYLDSLNSLATGDSVRMALFLGTYCPDSKKWIPRFYKLKPQLPISEELIISVDTTKTDERGLAKTAGVEKIPTFIFYKGDIEIGRIVEKPKGRKLERNLYRILKKM